MTPDGKPVKASRIFLGREHEFQTSRIENHFGKSKGYCNDIRYDVERIRTLLREADDNKKLIPSCMEGTGPFPAKSSKEWIIGQFASCEDAYLQLLIDLTCMLKYSVQLVDNTATKTIFIEGGFGDNDVFMNLLANHFPGKKIKVSFLKQATALGAVLQINESAKLEDWKFQSYTASDISGLLESYCQKNHRDTGTQSS